MSAFPRVSDFDFDLPPELVAQTPPAIRGASRLMRLGRESGAVSHGVFADLPGLLAPDDLLVMNDTRVFPARLLGRRQPGGGAVECLLMSRLDAGGPTEDSQTWLALVNPGPRVKVGALMVFEGAGEPLHGEFIERAEHGRVVRLFTRDGSDVSAAIHRLGHIPLPPYIKRADASSDRERYQTVYARHEGSIAAPTAGLHFTPELLAALDRAGIERATITLHVGYGTFQPVRVDLVADHRMARENYEVGPEAALALTRALAAGRRIVAVGTTTTRTLESLDLVAAADEQPQRGATNIFIAPGHRFRVVGGLVTNFHVPRSSLLMLVSAFAGVEPVRQAYRDAVAARYRFYSYGDAMFIG
ncbi:MAG: tRNA preQ1(34) S-adenosylmethionine ribosyltransferase-isomerase QueA [Acidobacteriota bacterium]